MCKCTCCGGRNLCGPVIKPNNSAENYRIGLIVIVCLHFAVFVVKSIFTGIFSGITDLVAITFLIIAIIRFDFCQLMCYIVLNLLNVFRLLWFWDFIYRLILARMPQVRNITLKIMIKLVAIIEMDMPMILKILIQ